jgi:tungstate transport system permease protein
MNLILDGIKTALKLLFSLDAEVLAVTLLSLKVSTTATALSLFSGIPAGVFLALSRFPGRRFIISLVNTGMGLPPVVVGLFVYILLSRSGPMGSLRWLFTPAAMIAAQTIIAFPLVAALTMSAVAGVDKAVHAQVVALGASPLQTAWTVVREARVGVTAAIVAAFGAVISEVGAVMLVGGNIEGQTRVLTTAIVLYTRQGDFAMAMALGIVLITVAFAANLLLLRLQWRLADR